MGLDFSGMKARTSFRLALAVFAATACACCFGERAPLVSLEAPVSKWHDGVPLGNGGAGALLWGGGETLNVTLDRADFWHNIHMPCYLRPEFSWATLVDVVRRKDGASGITPGPGI